MIVQPRLDIPLEISEGIASGAYKLSGGTVRDAAAGYIVKQLKEAPAEAVEQVAVAAKGAAARVTSALKDPWVIGVTLLGTVVLAAATAAIISNNRAKLKDKAKLIEVPEYIMRYNDALRSYLEAARTGTLEESVITELIDTLDEMAADGTIEFANEESERLVSLLVGYTRMLADANSVNLDELLETAAEGDLAGELRRHLVAQRSILSASD